MTPSAGYTRLTHRATSARWLEPPRRALLGAARATYRTSRPVLPSRVELPVLLNRRRLTGRGAEIGVKEGEFSEVLLDRWRGRELVSIDPWTAADPGEYVDVANVEQAEHDRYHAAARARLARFGERSTIWRATSAEGARRTGDASLDFAYVDARHDYESVLEDLALWLPKVRPGGILAGHDYVDGDLPDGVFGVRSAVDDFFGARGLRVGATFTDPPWPTWFVLVPAGR